MTKFKFDPLVMETFDRLAGVKAFIEHSDKSIPEMEWHARETLKQMAESEHWDYSDYYPEQLLLDQKYGHWVPRYAAYSSAVLVYSIVESQLTACAERIGNQCGSAFRVQDLNGRGIDVPALYLKKVGGADLKMDPAWSSLKDLQRLRNIIVHRGGLRGAAVEHQKEFDGLISRSNGNLSKVSSPGGGDALSVRLRHCAKYAEDVEDFFRRLFRSLGLPATGISVVE